MNQEIKKTVIDEEKFFDYLDAPIKDLDLLIRTGGEMRLSNFLLFHIAYTELFFTEKLWPDFTKKDFVIHLFMIFCDFQKNHEAGKDFDIFANFLLKKCW